MLLDAEHDIDVVGTAATTGELLELCDREHPQVAILQADVGLADTVRTVSTLRRRHRRLRVVGIYNTI